jgi:hypothetical protein
MDSRARSASATRSAWRNEAGVVHSIEALEDSAVLEVSAPQLDDVVRLQDRYGRSKKGPVAPVDSPCAGER